MYICSLIGTLPLLFRDAPLAMPPPPAANDTPIVLGPPIVTQPRAPSDERIDSGDKDPIVDSLKL